MSNKSLNSTLSGIKIFLSYLMISISLLNSVFSFMSILTTGSEIDKLKFGNFSLSISL